MRRTRFLILCLLAGCSNAQPSASVTPARSVPSGVNSTQGLYEPPRPSAARTEKGKTAEKWSVSLYAPDPGTRQQAARALRDLDEAGYPHLLRGIKDRSSDVRLTSLHALDKVVFLNHQQELLPLLVPMLREADPRLREAAAVRLGWCGATARDAVPHLQQLSKADPDSDVRLAARNSIEDITGKADPVSSPDP